MRNFQLTPPAESIIQNYSEPNLNKIFFLLWAKVFYVGGKPSMFPVLDREKEQWLFQDISSCRDVCFISSKHLQYTFIIIVITIIRRIILEQQNWRASMDHKLSNTGSSEPLSHPAVFSIWIYYTAVFTGHSEWLLLKGILFTKEHLNSQLTTSSSGFIFWW